MKKIKKLKKLVLRAEMDKIRGGCLHPDFCGYALTICDGYYYSPPWHGGGGGGSSYEPPGTKCGCSGCAYEDGGAGFALGMALTGSYGHDCTWLSIF